MKKITLSLIFLFAFNISYGQKVLPLWPDEIPNSQQTDKTEIHEINDILRIGQVQVPTLEIYLPTKRHSTGQAVVICPGGGYRILAYDWEGTNIAKWLNSKGIAAFVLKYRLPISGSVVTPHQAPLQDAKRAIRTVRANAEEWNLSENKIGVMGFSAGGHLASTLGTHFNREETIDDKDSIDTMSARPDFMILVYPVITMKESFTHQGSLNNLLGDNPDDEMIEYYSNETQVTEETPPTFLIHASDDTAVPVQNSLMFYKALNENGISSEMHIYPEGGHGFALGLGKGHLQGWTDRLYDWLQYVDK
ncbi:alpha/beta hydrolase [Rhodohalobacter sp. 614A]|uniref:alpha/beta hydrolase n=1 Tax=Rhodohalobacter sp. 614A TaxID=2908649 RepID=UPI001F3D6F46|nr:alpha/beta hydrolase [Rhodohalobacter sp. 614A]